MASPRRLMMLDSGAYTVWSQGATIDVQEYIKFCQENLDCSYFVNLDVIAGTPDDSRRCGPDDVDRAADSSWSNYLAMCKELPPEKVIPVYHYGESVKHLDKMLAYGCPYVGLGGSAHKATGQRVRWLQSLRKHLFDGAGRPVAKTHGFALTSYDLMKVWQWHSVDSNSWKDFATYGAVYVPIERAGQFDYATKPLVVFVSPQSKKRMRQQHYETMSPLLRARMVDWLASCNVVMGETSYHQKDDKYKLNVQAGELWFDKAKRVMMRPEVKGASNSFEERARVNAKFVSRSNRVLPIDHMYMAGQVMPYQLEFQLRRRLLSYHYTRQTPSATKYFQRHLELIREGL